MFNVKALPNKPKTSMSTEFEGDKGDKRENRCRILENMTVKTLN
jgi:hypothetical protein